MRTSRLTTDVDLLEWQQLSPVLRQKLLNGRPEEGAHTLLLQSSPRAANGLSFGHYHPVAEEFFCLDADFTFDGKVWLRTGSYAYFPAYCVHGQNVHVRGGYFMYLRLSGPNELILLNESKEQDPRYPYVGESECNSGIVQWVDPEKSVRATSRPGDDSLQMQSLRRCAVTGEGSTLLAVPEGSAGRHIELETRGLLEIMTLSGAFRLPDGTCLTRLSYYCDVDCRPRVGLHCGPGGRLLISHGGDLECRSG